jgi:hypothetical protein
MQLQSYLHIGLHMLIVHQRFKRDMSYLHIGLHMLIEMGQD